MLTLAQRKTLTFLQAFIEKNDYAPTSAEIAAGIGIKSRGVVHRYLRALQHAGIIDLLPGRHRNIILIEQDIKAAAVGLPLVGVIAAGQPIEAVESNDMINVVQAMIAENRFALRVKGDSMVEEGIIDGDIVVCEYADRAESGQIVVALVDGYEATLKKIIKHGDGYVTLLGANANFRPMRLAVGRVYIQGIFVGLLRFA